LHTVLASLYSSSPLNHYFIPIPQSGYKELKRVAVQERSKPLHPEQSSYQGVADLPSLLRQLNLEHYEDCFDREEVELATFLTMTEPDLKEIGINTLGARRKLQIAISGQWVGQWVRCGWVLLSFGGVCLGRILFW